MFVLGPLGILGVMHGLDRKIYLTNSPRCQPRSKKGCAGEESRREDE